MANFITIHNRIGEGHYQAHVIATSKIVQIRWRRSDPLDHTFIEMQNAYDYECVKESPDEIQAMIEGKSSGKGGKVFKDVREYITKNRDFIFTLALLFLADHFLLGGAMRAKLEGILHKQADRLVEATDATKAS